MGLHDTLFFSLSRIADCFFYKTSWSSEITVENFDSISKLKLRNIPYDLLPEYLKIDSQCNF